MFVHVMYFWYFICIFYSLQDQLSATGLFEEAFALAESLARTADPYSNRIESSLYGGSHRCAGCENMHTMPCSRIHSTFWHPTLSQYIRLSHTLYTPVVTALHFHGLSDALHTHNTSAFLTPYTRLWSQPIPVDFLTLYTHTIQPTFSHPTHACGHSLTFPCVHKDRDDAIEAFPPAKGADMGGDSKSKWEAASKARAVGVVAMDQLLTRLRQVCVCEIGRASCRERV